VSQIPKPNVLFLVTSYVRNKKDQSAWHDHLKECAKQGVDYDVVMPHDNEDSKSVEVIDKIKIHRFQYFFPRSSQKLAYYGGVAHNFSNKLSAKLQMPFFMANFFVKAMRWAKGKDVLHAMFLPSELVAVTLKKITGKPFVIWVQRTVYGPKFFRYLKGIVFKNCDYVMFNSTYTRDTTLKEFKPKKYCVLHMGLDLNYFKPMAKEACRKQLGLPPNKKILFTVGRFVEKKGFEYLIDAMSKVKTKNLVCVIGGSGPLDEKFKQMVNEKGLGGKIIFPGWVSNKEVRLWMNAADVFVVPSIFDSRGETETLGIVAVEAIACGTPTIASSVGGLVDVVQHGLNGFRVKQKSSRDIAEKIDMIFSKPGLVDVLGKNARKYAQENYTVKQAVDKILDVYKEVLDSKS
jgi:glycosyltransferase involved in cell wall biosynthesis